MCNTARGGNPGTGLGVLPERFGTSSAEPPVTSGAVSIGLLPAVISTSKVPARAKVVLGLPMRGPMEVSPDHCHWEAP